ncbi:Dyp-type peroxidase [Ramlibacter solisilvae]|uniref:Peroxidase n=1 Tax=Ramlibacter tataouinensis TaxID=94132 RepID=A0A127JT19_9BURK|nr:Dyp-type peroxidase [Ramlibacter tataouinensis]AMO23039.1 peroxidase [Ramlibacter tataouinensis]
MNVNPLYQPGILEPVPAVARYVNFVLPERGTGVEEVKEALARLSPLVDGSDVVLGIGPALVAALDAQVPGLHEFPDFSGHGVKVPSTPGTLWCWVRGDDLGDLLHHTRKVQKALAPAFVVRHVVDSFRHSWSGTHGRDLTGYEDGTENPEGEAAEEAAFAHGMGPGIDGSSYVAVQQWLHDLDAFEALTDEIANQHIGRDRVTNEELEDSPQSSHVKRTAQESFDPEAFLLRRSMPWMMSMQAGLMFVAFGKSLYAFEAQMRRMAGQEDGVTDAIFRISKPVNGAYYWCPPMREGKLDLRQLGL